MQLRLIIGILLLLALPLALASCGDSDVVSPEDYDPLKDVSFGDDEHLEIVTWNIEQFPRPELVDDQYAAVDLVARIVEALDADIYGLQEIRSGYMFAALCDSLPGYEGFRAPSGGNWSLAYLYKSSTVAIDDIHEIYADLDDPFPRPPLVLEGAWNGKPLTVIDNHLKAYDDNIIDYGNPRDDEYRRLWACELLRDHILQQRPDEAVVVVGDWNDKLPDPPSYNVFQPLLDLPESFRFVDMAIAEGDPAYHSFYSTQGHLDHIMVTDELFAAVEAPDAAVEVFRLDRTLRDYASLVSDHRPVGLRVSWE